MLRKYLDIGNESNLLNLPSRRINNEVNASIVRSGKVVLLWSMTLTASLSVFYWFFDAYDFVAIIATQLILYILIFIWLGRYKNHKIASLAASLITLIGIVAVCMISGGVRSPAVSFLILITIVGSFTRSYLIAALYVIFGTISVFTVVVTDVFLQWARPFYIEGVSLENFTILVFSLALITNLVLTSIFWNDFRGSNEAVDKLVFIDHLTDLPNRHTLDRDALNIVDYRRYAIFIDVDGFKEVNDNITHRAGDKLLVFIANALRELSGSYFGGENDNIIRFGGDEFVLLVEDVEGLEIEVLAEKVRCALKFEFKFEAISMPSTASIGVAACEAGECFFDAITRADLAMYEAKSRGGDAAVMFEQKMALDSAKKYQQRLDVKIMLDNDNFEVVYQPIYELASGEVAMVECLFRPNHLDVEEGGVDYLIEAAESSGDIQRLGSAVASRVADTLAGFAQADVGLLKFSINVSALELLSPSYCDQLTETFKSKGVDPSRIIIEIKESEYLNYDRSVAEVIRQLKRQGFDFAIDDFGTRYSSINEIRRLEFVYLKIDRSFVACTDGRNLSEPNLVQAMIHMAQSLDMRVIAEGVETEQQCQILRDLECDFVQGFYLNHPITATELGDWIAGSKEKNVF